MILHVPSEEYPTFGDACQAARRGDVIKLAPGDYTVTGGITMLLAGVAIEGSGRDLTTLQWQPDKEG